MGAQSIGMNADLTAQHRLAHLAAKAARAVTGVASVADSDVQIQLAPDGSVSVGCTITACQDTHLHEVGLAVQLAIAAVLTHTVGSDVRNVNIAIIDIDERATVPRTSNPLGKKRHYG
jgi:uncharacterized alkaline shock family protein YloU